MNIKVGPYFDGDEIKLEHYHVLRKPSREILEKVRLRPVYERFPSPRAGRSPTLPSFHIPKYNSYAYDDSPSVLAISTPISPIASLYSNQLTSLIGAVLNSINYFLGIGVLCLPHTLTVCGWRGILILIVMSLIMSYPGVLLGRCQYKHSLMSYPDIVEAAFGDRCRILASMAFYLVLLFDLVLYLEIIVGTADAVIIEHKWRIDHTVVVGMITIAMMVLINIYSDMKLIYYASIIGSVSIAIMCVTIVVACYLLLVRNRTTDDIHSSASQPTNQYHSYSNSNSTSLLAHIDSSLSLKNHHIDIRSVSQCIGVYGFCFMGHPVLPSVFKWMKRPSKYPWVVCMTFFFILVVCLAIAVIGFATFQSNSMENIAHNFSTDSFPILPIFLLSLTIIAALSKFTTTAFSLVQGLIDALDLEEVMPVTMKTSESTYLLHQGPIQPSDHAVSVIGNSWLPVLIRSTIPIIAMLIACWLPKFFILVNTVGGTFGILISVIIPTACYVRLFKDTQTKLSQLLHWALVVVGIVITSMVISEVIM